jgi:hypothetical protein
MNSISGMLPKCWVEHSSSSHNKFSSTSVWANGSSDFTPPPDAQVWELVIFYILYSINIVKKPSLIPWLIKSMCSITLHQPVWEHLVNRRAGWGTHFSKGSSTTLRMVVDITWAIPCLHEMRKSWYEFGFMSCMCMSMRQCGWLLLDDVDDLSYASKICVNLYR